MSKTPRQTSDAPPPTEQGNENVNRPVCGIVMPISDMDEYTSSHWKDVLTLLVDAANAAGYQGNLVSDSPEVGVIQRRIVQNLYDNEVVICDVSGKNPNVMFELGLRLAFDKPTIIVQDDVTKAPFDTSIIEYLEYPKSLHYYQINTFRDRLRDKIVATRAKFAEDASYSTFLKHFGEFKASEISKTEVPGIEFMMKEMQGLRDDLRSERILRAQSARRTPSISRPEVAVHVDSLNEEEYNRFREMASTTGITYRVTRTLQGGRLWRIPSDTPALAERLADASRMAGIGGRLLETEEGYEFMPF